MAGDLRRLVKNPDGTRYEVVGSGKEWKLGTGSVLLDAAAFVWAAIRQARGKEWVVVARRADSEADPVIRRLVYSSQSNRPLHSAPCRRQAQNQSHSGGSLW